MTDRYENIRKALEMGPTPGPWDGIQNDGSRWIDIYQISNQRCATPIVYVPPCNVLEENCIWKESKDETTANAKHVAACDPDTIRALLDERDALEAENERLREQLHLATVDQAIAEAEASDALEAAREDAARYRWLRERVSVWSTNDGKGSVSWFPVAKVPASSSMQDETDAAIDQAIAAEKKEK